MKSSYLEKFRRILRQSEYFTVGTALAIEKEMDDAQGIRDASASGKRKEDQPSSSLSLEVKASGKSHCMGKFSSRI